MEVAGGGRTLTGHNACSSEPSVVKAITTAWPGFMAVITPLSSTVTILLSDELHSTDGFVVFAGETVAVSVAVEPIISSMYSLSRLMPVALTGLTVTSQ